MTVARPRRERPSSSEETERVTRIYEWLISWADKSIPEVARYQAATLDHHLALLTIAERIAARTED